MSSFLDLAASCGGTPLSHLIPLVYLNTPALAHLSTGDA